MTKFYDILNKKLRQISWIFTKIHENSWISRVSQINFRCGPCFNETICLPYAIFILSCGFFFPLSIVIVSAILIILKIKKVRSLYKKGHTVLSSVKKLSESLTMCWFFKSPRIADLCNCDGRSDREVEWLFGKAYLPWSR